VVNPDIGDVDIFGLGERPHSSYVNYMRVIDGAVVHGITIELKRRLEETDVEMLQLAIAELRQRYHGTRARGHRALRPRIEVPGLTFIVPQRGDKKKLLELCERNAHYFMPTSRSRNPWSIPRPAPRACWSR
jgi:excinuclease ABC subunit C